MRRCGVYTLCLSIFLELMLQCVDETYHQGLTVKLQIWTEDYRRLLGFQASARQMHDLAFKSNLVQMQLQQTLKE